MPHLGLVHDALLLQLHDLQLEIADAVLGLHECLVLQPAHGGLRVEGERVEADVQRGEHEALVAVRRSPVRSISDSNTVIG